MSNIQNIDKALAELDALKDAEIVLLSEGADRMEQDTSAKIGSGFDALDNCIDGGFREGDFNVISGVPGEGKTTACRMFTMNLAAMGIPSLWFSYEMTLRELWDSFDKMGADKSLISYAPLELNDDYAWLERHMDKAIHEHGVKAIFIDTLGDIVKSVSSPQEMSNYANYLAQLCKDLRMYAIKNNVMIFAIAHAVKNTRSRSNETDNADIANSNGIPAAATNIFHVWRDEGVTIMKIGKSRRDGTKKNERIYFAFEDNKLVELKEKPKETKTW
jgi:predicted ATP-dependent serine protease